MDIKPSIWCILTKENYKQLYPSLNLNINDLCPKCILFDIHCFIFNHRDKFKYFYAYQKNPYIIDDVSNMVYLIEEM
jgi:hypothetical protein